MSVRERRNAVAEQRNQLWSQMAAIIEGAASANRDMSAEERTRYEQLETDLDTLGAEAARLDAHEERATQLTQPRRQVRLLPGGDLVVSAPQGQPVSVEEYDEAFRAYIRVGERRMSQDQIAALGAGYRPNDQARALTVTTTAGGYLIPQGFADVLVKSRLAFGGMRQANTKKITTETGDDLPIPGMDDTGNKGMLLAINTGSTTLDVAFTSRTLKAYIMHSKSVKVPIQLMQDSAFDVETMILAPAFGERIGRIENDYFTTGTGSSEPQGFITGASSGLTGTGAAASGPSYADVVALYHSVDPAYRDVAQFMANDASVLALRLLTDDANRPIWLPATSGGLAEATPDTLLGKRLVINQSMASPAANAKSLAFGDFSQFWIRDIQGVTVVRQDELYSDALQVGFFAYARVDSILVDAGTDPIKYYTCAAA